MAGEGCECTLSLGDHRKGMHIYNPTNGLVIGRQTSISASFYFLISFPSLCQPGCPVADIDPHSVFYQAPVPSTI